MTPAEIQNTIDQLNVERKRQVSILTSAENSYRAWLADYESNKTVCDAKLITSKRNQCNSDNEFRLERARYYQGLMVNTQKAINSIDQQIMTAQANLKLANATASEVSKTLASQGISEATLIEEARLKAENDRIANEQTAAARSEAILQQSAAQLKTAESDAAAQKRKNMIIIGVVIVVVVIAGILIYRKIKKKS